MLRRNTLIGMTGWSLLLFGILDHWVIFPAILNSKVHEKIQLKDSPTRELWSKLPFFIEFRMYLYNVSNADEVSQGAKPRLQEVGPYFFEEWHEKVDIVDGEEDDTAEYAVKNTFVFRQDLSEGLTGDEELIMPHIFMLGIIMTAYRKEPKILPIINKAMNSIFKNPTSIFIKVKAMDMIFGGLPIDCNITDFAGSQVCAIIGKNEGTLQDDGPNSYRFSLLGAKNNTPSSHRIRVLRGVKNLTDIGVVVESNGKPNISIWDDDYCDTFRGTDGTIFHPWLYEDQDIVSYSSDLCRSLSAKFQKKTVIKGIQTNRYTVFLGDSSTVPEEKCYCSASNTCLKAGVYDLYKCAGVSLVLSHPHFYLGDNSYLEMVDGLRPSQELHELFLDFEPFMGVPLLAKRRIQFNIFIHRLDKFKIMNNFSDALLPLFWIEEGIIAPNLIVDQIKMVFTYKLVFSCIDYISIAVGLILLLLAAYLIFASNNSKTFEINKVT